MKKVFPLGLLLLLWPLLLAAQSVPVPTTIPFAGLTLRLTNGGQRLIQQKVDALRSHPASFQARVSLADAYFPLIEQVFQQEGVPLDFRYLALQESGLQGEAQSIHDAVGYWQFKREAAIDFGLTMNDQVDERKHIVASSRAAAQYLKRSQNAFHNWLDVLLSYNLGIGGTKPYTLPTDATATEMEVSEQTHPYILTFLAHKIAYEPAVGMNASPALALQEFPAQPGQDLTTLAQTYRTSPDELARHNRWLLAGTVPADKAYTVLVPITDGTQVAALAAQPRAAVATQLLEQPTPDPRHPGFVLVNGLRALVALPGDTKEGMARRANLKLRKFMQFNDLFAFDNITAGQPYFVQKKRDKAAVEYHVAQPDESIITISQKYGVRARSIRQKNRMGRNEELRVGRVLWLQHTRPRDVAVEYVNNQNTTALTAFSPSATPSSTPPAPAAQPAAASTPAPARQPATSRPVAPTPTTADTLAAVSTTPAAGDSSLAETADTMAVAAAPAAQPTTAAQPATAGSRRGIYNAPPAKKPLPPSAPLADEPQPDSTAATATPTTTEPATPVIVPAPNVVLRDPDAPKTTSVSATAPKPATTPKAPASAAAPTPSTPVTPATTPAQLPASGLHTVQPKETLYAIARLYNISPRDLEAWNGLPLNPSLQIGQQLRVVPPVAAAPTAAPTAAAPATSKTLPTPAAKPATSSTSTAPQAAPTPAAKSATIQHTVQAGESMYGISRKYGVTIKQILEWNGKTDFNVKPGEVLTITPTK